MKTPRLFVLVHALALFVPVVDAQTAAPAASPVSRFAIPATDDGLPGEGPIRRAEWFQKLWVERRTSFANRERNDQGAL
ncbi:MAG: G-D-S-L family lipolytic protein, partial [Verrucomicrobia bacterium]|nr:G-D-S-L family lipolytic protein [Verrucomicrobiota bacterium]